MLTLEYADDPQIFGMPEDVPSDERARDEHGKANDKKVRLVFVALNFNVC